MTSFEFSIGLTITTFLTSFSSYLASMKLIIIFVIMYKLAYQNNSNYLSVFMSMYLFFADAQVDIIILLNHFGLFILYNIFLRILRNIKILSIAFIKK